MDARETAERAPLRNYVVGRMEAGLCKVPAHMHDCVRDYVLRGELDDGFLTAVLSNDLKGAFMFGDETNIAAMRSWVWFVINHLPAGAQGSAENVDAWRGGGGFDGFPAGTPVGPPTDRLMDIDRPSPFDDDNVF